MTIISTPFEIPETVVTRRYPPQPVRARSSIRGVSLSAIPLVVQPRIDPPRVAAAVNLTAAPASRINDEFEESETSSESDLEERKVPKPNGEASRPNRGGYNFRAQLSWPKSTYNQFRVG